MNPREMKLMIVLGVIVIGGGGSIAFYSWFYKPFMDYGSTIAKLEKANRDKRDLKEETYKEMQNLERLRNMSLSPKPEVAKAEYDTYLSTLLSNCKLVYDLRAGVISDVKGPGGGNPNAVRPGHQILSYEVRVAKADLRNVVRALDLIQKTPLVHRIKSLTIERVDTSAKNTTDQVKVQMTIESLIVSRAEPRPGGPLALDQRLIVLEAWSTLNRGPGGIALLPWLGYPTGPFANRQTNPEAAYRQYADIGRKNIFIGPVPAYKPPEVNEFPDAGFPIADYVRLDTCDPTSKEAFFRNLVFKVRPIRVKAVPGSGYDTFRVKNEWNTEDILRGKVLKVDQRDVYFQVQEEIYRVHIGQSLGEALSRPLTDAQIEAYGLATLYDAEWAEREVRAARDALAAKKKKGKGG